jgi:ABC-type transporter Mla subunit MlaD
MAEITIRISDQALKIGLIVLSGGLGELAFLVSSGVFEPKYRIQMFVPKAAGLQHGATVRLDGLLGSRYINIHRVSVEEERKRRLLRKAVATRKARTSGGRAAAFAILAR